jgi:hypothetical protein
MSEKPLPVEHAAFRIYRTAEGRFKAYGTVERKDGKRPPIVESGEEASAPAALAEALVLAGFVT